MLSGLIKGYSECGGLAMTCYHDPLQLMNARSDLYAGLQAQIRGAANCANEKQSRDALIGQTCAFAKLRLEEETRRYTRLEF